MKAVLVENYGGPGVLQVREVPLPEPGPGQLRICLAAAGVNPVDTYMRSRIYGYEPSLPWIPGIDGSGWVDAMGPGVSSFQIGQRVYLAGALTGTYAEACLATTRQVIPLPEGLGFPEAACLYIPYVTSWLALLRGEAHSGEILFVHGASGAVGIAALQWARKLGLEAWGSAGSPEGRKLVEAQGVRGCLNHRQDNYGQVLMETFASSGVDLILEMCAETNLAADLQILAPKGRIMVIGSRGEVRISPRDLIRSEGSIQGLRILDLSKEEFDGAIQAINTALQDGEIQPPIRVVYPLEQAEQAHEEIMDKPHAGNIVIDCLSNELS